MNKYLLYLFLVLVLSGGLCGISCTMPLRTIAVTLADTHPWENACHKPMWYTLVWTDGSGGFQRLHMEAGIRTAEIPIPRGRSIVFCAYPLGELEPLGGVFSPLSSSSHVVLTQQEGSLAKLLQLLYQTAPQPIGRINYPVLIDMMHDNLGDDLRFVDGNRLGKDILNGTLSEDSIKRIPGSEVSLTNLPTGKWVAASPMDESFWYDFDTDRVNLSLPGGTHRFLNREAGLELRVVIDEYSDRQFQYIRQPPAFLL